MEYLFSVFLTICIILLKASSLAALSDCLFTDLIDIMGTKEPCRTTTRNSRNKTTQAFLALSHMQFYQMKHQAQHTVSTHCSSDSDDATPVPRYDWTCFLSLFGHAGLSEHGWFFVSCAEQHVTGTTCLNGSDRAAVVSRLCGISDVDKTCLALDDTSVCSSNFKVEKCPDEDSLSHKVPLTSYDIVAYICVVFIVSSFIIAVCVPANRCQPHQRKKELRVPLCIYEMYGWPKRNGKPSMTRNDKPPDIAITITDVGENNNVTEVSNTAIVDNDQIPVGPNTIENAQESGNCGIPIYVGDKDPAYKDPNLDTTIQEPQFGNNGIPVYVGNKQVDSLNHRPGLMVPGHGIGNNGAPINVGEIEPESMGPNPSTAVVVSEFGSHGNDGAQQYDTISEESYVQYSESGERNESNDASVTAQASLPAFKGSVEDDTNATTSNNAPVSDEETISIHVDISRLVDRRVSIC